MRKIVIDPVTRLEGHGKIAIFLNDDVPSRIAIFRCPN